MKIKIVTVHCRKYGGKKRMCGQKDSPDEFRFSPVLIGAFCVLIYPFFGQFPAHFLVCAVHGAEGGVGRGQGVLSGKVDIGLSLAEQLDGISVFVPTKLINTVAFRAKAEMIGNHRALPIVKAFVSVKQRLRLPMLEEQPFEVRSVISGHILRRAFAVLIGITAVKVGIVGTVDAGADDFLGVPDAFANLCGNL